MKKATLLLLLATFGCSSHHPYIPPNQAQYGPPQWGADGEMVRYRIPPQLTSFGCALHKVVTLGKTAEECRKPKKHR